MNLLYHTPPASTSTVTVTVTDPHAVVTTIDFTDVKYQAVFKNILSRLQIAETRITNNISNKVENSDETNMHVMDLKMVIMLLSAKCST